MSIKLRLFNIFILLIIMSQVQAYENDLNVAETAVAKKAITTGSAVKVGQKGVLVAGGKKLAKGAVVGKSFGAKANKFKAGKVEGAAGFKKAGKKAGFLDKKGIKKVKVSKKGYDKAFAVGSKQSFGKLAMFGNKSKFALGKSKGFASDVKGLKGGMKKKGIFAAGIDTGAKKISKVDKMAFGKGVGGKVIAGNGVIGGDVFKKGVSVAGKVGAVNKSMAGKGLKG